MILHNDVSHVTRMARVMHLALIVKDSELTVLLLIILDVAQKYLIIINPGDRR